ncbi:MAG: DNA primase, partial [Actinomycetota bacterium]
MQGLIVADDIDELRERSDIVEVVAGHLKLRKAGRMFKGLCCFHQEKTPSFTVDPDKQLFHCFGCGVGGDVFTFIRRVEGLTFTEAAERLAGRVAMTLRYEGGSAEKGRSRHALLDACTEACEYFQNLLQTSPEAAAARRYLEGRGFGPQEGAEFKLGYAPQGRDTLYRHLLSKKFTSQNIVEAGLALVTDDGQHRDRFRGRLMFPVSDITGNVIGFGARTLTEEQPKYLNSPESAIYHKAKLLYGLDKAKASITTSGTAVVTEGYTDVMGLWKAGIKTAVATCGTALGEEHFVLLKRFCERVVLAFDADAAGVVASERGFGLHERIGLEV